VYFYSATGRYQPTSFLAMVSLIKDFERRKWFERFTDVRSRFESFLLRYKAFSNQMTVKYGSGAKGFDRLKSLYLLVLDELAAGKSEEEILYAVRADDRFSFLVVEPAEGGGGRTGRRSFDSETKSEAFLREALASPVKCRICSGLIHLNSITVDHIIRKQDGGIAVAANAQLAHPYCNTGYKEAIHARQARQRQEPVVGNE
jgi:hypothetical protein